MMATATVQTGLLTALTGHPTNPSDVSGPYSLGVGMLIRKLRRDGDKWRFEGESRSGWQEYVSYAEPQIGDVEAIRAEQRAEKPIPVPPEGAVRFVWVWNEPKLGPTCFRYQPGKRPEKYQN